MEHASRAAKKARKKKAYVPALRSGAYALVLGLSSVPEDSLRSFSKSELIVLAQPHCDSSFEVSSEGNKFYSAWSSMRTLTEKDLVQEMGRPSRKYYLSDEGWEVARKIRAVQDQRHETNLTTNDTSMDKDNSTAHPPLVNPPSKPTRNDFVHLGEDSDWETLMPTSHDQAYSMTSETLTSRDTQSNLKSQRSGFNSIAQQGTSLSCPGLDRDSNIVSLLSSPEPERSKPPALSSSSSKDPKECAATSHVLTKLLPGKQCAPTALQRTDSFTKANESPMDALSTPAPSFPRLDPVAIAPGTFTVQLVLDTREVRSKTDRDYIHDELSTLR